VEKEEGQALEKRRKLGPNVKSVLRGDGFKEGRAQEGGGGR